MLLQFGGFGPSIGDGPAQSNDRNPSQDHHKYLVTAFGAKVPEAAQKVLISSGQGVEV